ncbi:MAG: ATP-dependent zinc metalloprotease FtsH [Parachlamydiales bacterium]|nr:ATP-dependent zinc metalloprotease FtsH [Parachlamydiales bacterium]
MNKKKTAPKKGFPGGILFILFILFITLMTVQSLSDKKGAKVFFSHQLEHLSNLQLLHPERSFKVAQNEKLVTFTGQFRQQETEEGKERFRYLTLLNSNHELVIEKEKLDREIVALQKNVVAAAEWFLQVSGTRIAPTGFMVVGSIYDTSTRVNSIVIESMASKQIITLPEVERNLAEVNQGSKESIDKISKEINSLLQIYRSPMLGIGSEIYKKELKELSDQLTKIQLEKNGSDHERIAIYKNILFRLRQMTDEIAKPYDNVSLLALRSVRNYMETIDRYNIIEKDLDQNEALLDKARQKVTGVVWFFNNKEVSSSVLEKENFEAFHHWYAQAKKEWENFAQNKGLSFKAPDQPLNTVLKKKFISQEPSPNYINYLFTILPIALVIFALYFIFSRQMKGVGSSAMNFGKSPARLLTKESNHVTFKDVAGAEEAKEELEEIVDFLKDPQKFTSLGARIPKGVLLVGPPGTGKTLVAKAVAGEADRPFFSISGSDFVEMFVGVGASRIRDLFDQAKKNAPCIIFVDEIDAVGRHRGAGIGGGHDEREQTLNQLLVEMDGFDTKEGVILMAATNRPDILDRALLRPGRFDRRVTLDLPDVKGRYEILKVHARKIKIDPSVNLQDVARNTPGASGADLENILNEAALLAARTGRSAVTAKEVTEACDKVRFGKERRSLEMDEQEKKTTAFHESGHAIVGLVVKNADPVDKVTIIPRGFSLGATHFMPKKNRLSYWRKEALDQLAIMMGGRAAEEIFVQDLSSGAQQDISQATKLARAMVCEWGMSDNLGTITYEERSENGQYLGLNGYHEKKYSEETARKIDQEVFRLVDEAHKRATQIVEENKEKVQLMADMLMEFETLDKNDVQEILQGTWNIETKRERMHQEDELQKKVPPPPPVSQKEKEPPFGAVPHEQEG